MFASTLLQPKSACVCEQCKQPLSGLNALFPVCDFCSDEVGYGLPTKEGYCKLHPGCGCQSAEECTEEHQ